MLEKSPEEVNVSETNTENAYEAPMIETVISPADLEREVHYAGFPVSPIGR
jgi:hypothetical protein